MAETRAALLVRLSPSLKSRLAEIAKREHRSLSKQVEFLLERYLDSAKVDGVSAEERSLTGRQSDIGTNPIKKKKTR